jgi:outer membrane murein-binding lipoprotein Lpp
MKPHSGMVICFFGVCILSGCATPSAREEELVREISVLSTSVHDLNQRVEVMSEEWQSLKPRVSLIVELLDEQINRPVAVADFIGIDDEGNEGGKVRAPPELQSQCD